MLHSMADFVWAGALLVAREPLAWICAVLAFGAAVFAFSRFLAERRLEDEDLSVW